MYHFRHNTMIKRDISDYLDSFFKKTEKALLVDGARQVGKTFSIRDFGERNFKKTIEINFVKTPAATSIFKNTESAEDILLRISAFAKTELIRGDTLIFFDEIQECPEVVTAVKFLVEEGSCRYIMSGSLLGVTLKDIRSEPVGYMDVKEMYPLDFKEFIFALGVSSQVFESVRAAWERKEPVDDFIHERLTGLFRLYLIVGGMPAAVSKYIETNDLQSVLNEQEAILRLYRRDITQYDKNNKLKIEEVFSLIPPELNAENKRFILKSLNQNARYDRYENGLLWMKNAGVAIPVYNTEEPVVPLLLARSRNLFKLFQNDIGLLAAQYAADNDVRLKILSGDDAVNYGAIYENAVAQELKAHGFIPYYFNSKKNGEVDFVIEYQGTILPIEVKSGKDYTRHRALANIMDVENYHLKKAVVFDNANLHVEGNILYAPIYMTMLLRRTPEIPFVYIADLSGLQ